MDGAGHVSLAAVERSTTLTVEQVLRYTWAAELCAGRRVLDLCCGTGYGARLLAERAAHVIGVDIDADAVAVGRRAFASVDRLALEVGDAAAFLRGADPEAIDAVVCFDALAQIEDVDALLERLRTLAAGGTIILLSLENALTFPRDTPYHQRPFDLAAARALFASVGEATLAFQYLAEGSMITAGDDVEQSAAGRPVDPAHLAQPLPEHGEPEYANTFLAAINPPESALSAAARLHLAAAPAYNRALLDLERANRELLRANGRLARDAAARYDSAAGATEARLQLALAEAEQHRRRAEEWHAEADRQAAGRRAAEEREGRAYHRLNQLQGRKAVRAALRVADLVRRR